MGLMHRFSHRPVPPLDEGTARAHLNFAWKDAPDSHEGRQLVYYAAKFTRLYPSSRNKIGMTGRTAPAVSASPRLAARPRRGVSRLMREVIADTLALISGGYG
jgi:hypothetical protein